MGYCVRIQVQKIGQLPIAPMPQLERFQSCIQTALLFIEQAVEQENRRPKFVGHLRRTEDTGGDGGLLQTRLSRQQLLLPLTPVTSTVQVQARDGLTGDLTLLDQLQERFLDRDVQDALQFGGEVARRRLMDEDFHRGDQSLVARKPNGVE